MGLRRKIKKIWEDKSKERLSMMLGLEKEAIILKKVQQRTEKMESKILPKEKKITGNMRIVEALELHSEAQQVFTAVGLDSCSRCAVRFDETLFEAADLYDFSLELFLLRLQILVEGEI